MLTVLIVLLAVGVAALLARPGFVEPRNFGSTHRICPYRGSILPLMA